MKKYILAIDQGTTGSTAMLCDSDTLKIKAKSNKEFRQIFPKTSWVEHDLKDIFDSVKQAVLEAIEKAQIHPKDIISIGITNQRETTCAFNKAGEPLARAIVWQDRRTQEFCQKRKKRYESLQKLTGLPLDPYFSATKMGWLLENNQMVINAKQKDDLLFGTIDTFLLYKLTGNKSYKTEASNASRTLLMDLKSGQWSDKLLHFFGIDSKNLPVIEDSFAEFGVTQALDFLPDGIPIQCILGDQQAALFGQGCFKEGQMKCTYGTGAFLLANTGDKILHSQNGLLTTFAYQYKGNKSYALEGSTYIAGAAVQWLRDNLGVIQHSSDIENLATDSPASKTEDLFFFPFFTGLGAPYWKSEVKASIIGMDRSTNKNDIAKVTLEGIAQSVCDSIAAFEKDLNEDIKSIKVDGGAALNDFLMQIQSNLSHKKIERPHTIETTALGVVYGAKLQMNQISLEELFNNHSSVQRAFNPEQDDYYNLKRDGWIRHLESL